MGRIKEISRKSAHTRKRNPVVYLICEGSETEIRYFKRFRSRGCNIDIIPISSQYKSADRLVQKAKATMGNNPYYPEDGDSIWCVFDRDDNSNEVLLRAKQSAQKEGYHLAYSNPSFELCRQSTLPGADAPRGSAYPHPAHEQSPCVLLSFPGSISADCPPSGIACCCGLLS